MSRVAAAGGGDRGSRGPFDDREMATGIRGEASIAQVDLQGAPSAWTYERRASVKLAKSQLRTVRASFENPSLEPKVQAPFETRPGEIPRRIQIERKRRLYSLHQIESLLLDRGINYAEPQESALAFLSPSIRALPVEVFDNDEFEVRSPENWLSLARDSDGNMAGLPARALFLQPDSTGLWRDSKVTGYDANTEEWLVEWLEGTTKEKSTQLKLPRLRVYLKAEDPFNFADRVADAHARRKEAELTILYNFYVDCMPSDDMAELESEEMSRIMTLCTNPCTAKADAGDMSGLIEEVSVDYLRTMNKIVLEAQTKEAHLPRGWKQPGAEILRSLRVPKQIYRVEKPPPPKVVKSAREESHGGMCSPLVDGV